LQYYPFTLSGVIQEEWKKQHPRTKTKPGRADLQALGNEIRREAQNPGQIARRSVQCLEDLREELNHIVLDGIRNVGEVETLRQRFGRSFYLVALECPPSERLERLRGIYGLG